ncbi:MAG: hypothetical protein NTV86_12750 [Planctomycetota bacterium]|nr:hypothetical protein [Planctomycetota bacterium]
MKSVHPIPDPTEHPNFHEEGHWITSGLAAVDLILVGVLIAAAIVGFWAALAWAVFRQ